MFIRSILLSAIFLFIGFLTTANAATFTVTLGGDTNNGACGQFCTLRDAITAGNANGAGADTINFNLGAGNVLIQPLSPLPAIKTSLTINGATQTGYFGTPIIIIEGNGAGANADGFLINSPAGNTTINVSILALAIYRFNRHGIQSNCSGACNLTVQGNRIGTSPLGTIDFGNGGDGIHIVESGGSTYTVGGAGTFEGNVISGNEGDGIHILPVSASVPNGTGTANIVGNLIGLNAAGTAALGNTGNGVRVEKAGNNSFQLTLNIGSTAAGGRNFISGNNEAGIFYEAHEVSILNNYIGTNQAGAAALPNRTVGIYAGESFHAVIGGASASSRNVVSGNDGNGITVGGKAEIYNNYVGTNAAGTAALGNGENGIYLFNSAVAAIGGTLTIANLPFDAGNLISGNALSGIAVYTEAPTQTYQIKRNRIGTNAAGDAAIPNQGHGIYMGFPGLLSNLPHVIGSETNAADGNLISGNAGTGIIVGSYNGVKIFGNKIGTNAAGTAKLGNQQAGIELRSANNQVGLAENATAANIISGNTGSGIIVTGVFASHNLIRNNYVGTNQNGADLGNGANGIYIYNSSNNSTGSPATNYGNRIAFNAGAGVAVHGQSVQNSIQWNSIYSNGGLGIDLNVDGVTPNDAGDEDGGANNSQNFPVLQRATPSRITGTLNANLFGSLSYNIEFYRVDSCDASGYGEGRYYLGSNGAFLNNAGNADISFPTTLIVGQWITATATPETFGGNTSEFSQCIQVTPEPGNLSFSAANYTVNEAAGTRTVVVNRTGGSYGSISVDYATTSGGTATAGQDYAAVSGTLTFADGEAAKSFDIPFTDDALDEADETVNLTLTNASPGVLLTPNPTAVLTIIDNDAPPTVSVSDNSALEGNQGTKTFSVSVTLSAPSSLPVSVEYQTADGTANASTDYLPKSGVLTFAPGETQKNPNMTVIGDLTPELDETFFVDLSNATNATFADNQAVVTILDDDNPGKFSFKFAPYSGTEHDIVEITVSRTNGAAGTVSVDYATGGGTATPGVDYTPVAGTLIFGDGETTKNFYVTLADDQIPEPNETVNLVLSNPIGGAGLSAPSTTVLNIIDNDSGTLLNLAGTVKKSDNTPVANVLMTLQGAANQTTTTDANGRYSFSNLAPNQNYTITPSAIGYTFSPINQQFNNLTADNSSVNFTATAAPARQLRVVGGNATPGQNAQIQIELVAQGDENTAAFSLNYDPAILTNPNAIVGVDAGGGFLTVNDSQFGKLGILLALPAGQSFAAGTKQIITVTFNTMPTAAYNSPVTFGDVPITKEVANTNADALPVNYLDGAVTFAQGFEADVAPRPTGNNNGAVTIADFTQVGKFVAGLDQMDANFNEFQRADCAPRISLGNGQLTAADYTQAGLYAAGLDSATLTGGAVSQNFAGGFTGAREFEKMLAAPTVVRVVNVDASPGSQVVVSIATDAQGTENGFGFTLDYDASKLSNPLVQKGADTQNATLIPNTNNSGKVGVVLGMPFGVGLIAGTKQLVTIRFDVAANAAGGNTSLIFNDSPVFREVADLNANVLPSSFQDGAINILGPTAASVTVSGKISDASGRGVPRARVSMTAPNGVTRTALTNSFGFYHFDDVEVGESYLFSVRHKKFQFEPHLITVLEEVNNLNFAASNRQ